jgi:hypothetical protein
MVQPNPNTNQPTYLFASDKNEDSVVVFVFASVDAQESATAPRAPRPAVAAADVDRQRTPETL